MDGIDHDLAAEVAEFNKRGKSQPLGEYDANENALANAESAQQWMERVAEDIGEVTNREAKEEIRLILDEIKGNIRKIENTIQERK